MTFENRLKQRLAAAPVKESSRVFAPLAAASQTGASNVGLYTTAGRRVVRKIWPNRTHLSQRRHHESRGFRQTTWRFRQENCGRFSYRRCVHFPPSCVRR